VSISLTGGRPAPDCALRRDRCTRKRVRTPSLSAPAYGPTEGHSHGRRGLVGDDCLALLGHVARHRPRPQTYEILTSVTGIPRSSIPHRENSYLRSAFLNTALKPFEVNRTEVTRMEAGQVPFDGFAGLWRDRRKVFESIL